MKCFCYFIAFLYSFAPLCVRADDDSKRKSVNSVSFDEVIVPFLDAYCIKCHGGSTPKGDLTLRGVSKDFTAATNLDVWQDVLEQLELGTMPPEKEGKRPKPSEVKQVTRWIGIQLKKVKQTAEVEHKLRSPEYGNYVNHQRLFDGSEKGPSSSPPRLWRLSPYVYDKFVNGVARDLRRQTAIHQPFPLDAEKGAIADFAAQQFAGAATLELLQMNCQTIVEFQTTGVLHRDHEGKLRRLKRTPREFEVIVKSEDRPTVEQIETAILFEYQLLLEQKPSSSELEQLVQFCQRAMDIGGNSRGLQTTLKAILMKPEAVYRMEIGLGALDDHGRRRLSHYELAFAIARALTDKGPGEIEVQFQAESKESLLALAERGVLSDPKNIKRVVAEILDVNNMSTANYRMFTEDHQIENTRVLRFFREFFGYHHAPKVFKDAKRIGFGDRYLTERMVDDADQFVMHVFDEDKEVLRNLLTTDKYFVAYLGSLENIQKDMHYIKTNVNDGNFKFNSAYVKRAEDAGRHPIPIEGPDSRRYVGFYNLDHETWDYPTRQPFKIPGKQRAGILMHPAWLIAWSGNFDNDPIRRGKWIREHLLAGTIPDIPLNVNAVVPDDHHKALRDRLQVTRAEYCWKCHQKMDPLGLPFERFDDFGRHRDREMVGELLSIFPERHADAKTLAIDTTGAINESGEAMLDGNAKDPFELVEKLAGSVRVRQSFVRHAFRFWMGRNETLDDSPTLMAADEAYVKNGGSMKAMIASLLSSDSFLYRKKK
jgi:hypothetical protein